MGWTKHYDAVRYQSAMRSKALSSLKAIVENLQSELECPDSGSGETVLELGSALHHALGQFVKLREAVGGDYDVDVSVYVHLILDAIPAFKWRAHVRPHVEHRRASPRVHRDR